MTEAAKYTPGPWQTYEVPTSINVRASDGAVCRVSISPNSVRVSEGRANARLIAAAPDLLAALTALLADCEEYARINNLHGSDGQPATDHAMRRADAAIALVTTN